MNPNMNTYRACEILEGFDDGEASQAERTEAMQFLIDNGMAYTLQGFFGRLAEDYINAGLCHRPVKEIHQYY